MDAIIRISSEEFDENLFRRIKSLLNTKKSVAITISITEDFRLNEAIANVEKGQNLSYFTLEQYEDFKKQLLNEP